MDYFVVVVELFVYFWNKALVGCIVCSSFFPFQWFFFFFFFFNLPFLFFFFFCFFFLRFFSFVLFFFFFFFFFFFKPFFFFVFFCLTYVTKVLLCRSIYIVANGTILFFFHFLRNSCRGCISSFF